MNMYKEIVAGNGERAVVSTTYVRNVDAVFEGGIHQQPSGSTRTAYDIPLTLTCFSSLFSGG